MPNSPNFIDQSFAKEKLYNFIISPVCEKYSLTFMEFTVLLFLARNPQYDTATEIVKYKHITKSHVSISLASLEEKGLIIKEYAATNHRTVHLKLTEKSKCIVSDGLNAQKRFTSILTEGFSDKETEELLSFIERIDKNVQNALIIERNGEN